MKLELSAYVKLCFRSIPGVWLDWMSAVVLSGSVDVEGVVLAPVLGLLYSS